MEISPARLAAAPEARGPEPTAEALKTARKFEEMFLAQTVDEMLKSVEIGGFGGGHAEETWRSFLARAFAEEIAEQGGTGIARSVAHAIEGYGKGEDEA